MDFLKKIAQIFNESTVDMTFTFKEGNFSATVRQKSESMEHVPFNVGGTIDELSTEKFFDILERPLTDTKIVVDNVAKVKKSVASREKSATGKKAAEKAAPKSVAKDEQEKKEEKKQQSIEIPTLD